VGAEVTVVQRSSTVDEKPINLKKVWAEVESSEGIFSILQSVLVRSPRLNPDLAQTVTIERLAHQYPPSTSLSSAIEGTIVIG
jgi:hypothetical protein